MKTAGASLVFLLAVAALTWLSVRFVLGRLPGDPPKEEMIARMIRVNQAGEYGAKRIYAGQIAVLGGGADGPVLRKMAAIEEEQKACVGSVTEKVVVRKVEVA